MKIKLFIVDLDANYLQKLSSVFNSKYSDKLEVYAFTDANIAASQAAMTRVDVVVANSDMKLSADDFPVGCCFIYFTDQMGVNELDGVKAINKYQKADSIYKEILDSYAEEHGNVVGRGKLGETKLIVFCSPAGGTGSSCLAAAFAKKCAASGLKCLYLNLEKYGCSDMFFSGEGIHTFSDVIYAMKSRKANLELKLESTVKQDASGVYFYAGTINAMDMQELSGAEMLELVDTIVKKASYNYVFLDIDYNASDDVISIWNLASAIIETSDGSDTANIKVKRGYEALKVIEQEKNKHVSDKCMLFYNKYSNKVSNEIEDCDIPNIGGAPKYEHASVTEVINELSKHKAIDEIL